MVNEPTPPSWTPTKTTNKSELKQKIKFRLSLSYFSIVWALGSRNFRLLQNGNCCKSAIGSFEITMVMLWPAFKFKIVQVILDNGLSAFDGQGEQREYLSKVL